MKTMLTKNWTPKECGILKANFASCDWEELLRLLPSRSRSSIKGKAQQLGLSRGGRFSFPPEADDFLKKHYANTLCEDIAKTLGCKKSSVYRRAKQLGLKKSKEFVAAISRDRSGDPSHPIHLYKFKKGLIPKNKGKRQTEYMSPEAIERSKATRFKKGHTPKNYKPIGHERITRDGYRMRKVGEPNVFKLVHRLVWEGEFGAIPEGFNIQFKDNNPLNCEIDNLYIIRREEQMLKNSILQYPKNLQKAIRLNAKLNKIINTKDEANKH